MNKQFSIAIVAILTLRIVAAEPGNDSWGRFVARIDKLGRMGPENPHFTTEFGQLIEQAPRHSANMLAALKRHGVSKYRRLTFLTLCQAANVKGLVDICSLLLHDEDEDVRIRAARIMGRQLMSHSPSKEVVLDIVELASFYAQNGDIRIAAHLSAVFALSPSSRHLETFERLMWRIENSSLKSKSSIREQVKANLSKHAQRLSGSG